MTTLLAVTLVSMLLAIVMSVIAWRAAREERMRSEARVAALAADIQTAMAAGGGRRAETATLHAVRPAPRAAADLFTATPETASSRSIVVVGIGLFALATVAALAVVLGSGSSRANVSTLAGRPPERSRAISASTPEREGSAQRLGPLDLVALGHERDADRLIVRGVVRNPSAGRGEHLTAVVFLFDRDGEFLSSGRAALDSALPPGGESAFTVIVPGARNVARYRVSFRTDAAVVPHVDRRRAE